MADFWEAAQQTCVWLGTEAGRIPVKVVYRPGATNVVADELSRCHGECVSRDTSFSMEEGGDVGLPTFESRKEKAENAREETE